jgi:hypothetical protein
LERRNAVTKESKESKESKEKPKLIKIKKRVNTEEKGDIVKRAKIGVSIEMGIWRRLRALAIKEGKLTGELLDKAIEEYLQKHE